jgi:hypothetical protein
METRGGCDCQIEALIALKPRPSLTPTWHEYDARVVKITRQMPVPVGRPVKSLASASVESCSFFENIGTKAMLKRLGKKSGEGFIGKENATKNAAKDWAGAKIAQDRISRTKPKTR